MNDVEVVDDRQREACAECHRMRPDTIEEEQSIGQPDSRFTHVYYPRHEEGTEATSPNVRWYLQHGRWRDCEDGEEIGVYVGEVWEFNPPRPDWVDNLLCDSCFLALKAAGKLRKVEGVCDGCYGPDHGGIICAACKVSHRCMACTARQGVDCAASVLHKKNKDGADRWFLIAFYGSDFDTMLFAFTREPPVRFQGDGTSEVRGADPVCDMCIRSLLSEGFLEEKPGDYPWGISWTEEGDPIPYEDSSMKRISDLTPEEMEDLREALQRES